jgi:hypothetical protein
MIDDEGELQANAASALLEYSSSHFLITYILRFTVYTTYY